MAKNNEDQVKRIFGKSANEIFSTLPTDHSKFHSPNAFCGNAGPEEMNHLQSLLDILNDSEIAKLTDAVGIKFGGPTGDIDRDTLEGVLDEADREDFYREYQKLISKRNNK